MSIPRLPVLTIALLAAVTAVTGVTGVTGAMGAAAPPASAAPVWSISPTPSPHLAGAAVLSSVSCPSARACVAVGYEVDAANSAGRPRGTLERDALGDRAHPHAPRRGQGLSLRRVMCHAAVVHRRGERDARPRDRRAHRALERCALARGTGARAGAPITTPGHLPGRGGVPDGDGVHRRGLRGQPRGHRGRDPRRPVDGGRGMGDPADGAAGRRERGVPVRRVMPVGCRLHGGGLSHHPLRDGRRPGRALDAGSLAQRAHPDAAGRVIGPAHRRLVSGARVLHRRRLLRYRGHRRDAGRALGRRALGHRAPALSARRASGPLRRGVVPVSCARAPPSGWSTTWRGSTRRWRSVGLPAGGPFSPRRRSGPSRPRPTPSSAACHARCRRAAPPSAMSTR